MTSSTASACILIVLANIITCEVITKYDTMQNQDVDDFHIGFYYFQTNLQDMSSREIEEFADYELLNSFGDTYTIRITIETLSGKMKRGSENNCIFTSGKDDKMESQEMIEEAEQPGDAADQMNARPNDRQYTIISSQIENYEGYSGITVMRFCEQAEEDMKTFECVSVTVVNDERLLMI